MRPFARRRSAWWDSFVCALALVVVLAAIAGFILLASLAGRRAVVPLIGLGAVLLGMSVQSRRVGFLMAIAGGWLLHGG